MVDVDLLTAHNVYSNKGVFALFLGSGVSRAAGIPTGWEVLQKLIGRLATLKTGKLPDDPMVWYQDYYKINPNYSNIIEELTSTAEERVNLLRPFFEATEDDISEGLKQPTIGHKAIAKLVQKGYVKVIVTTNFDRLMENALKELSIEATVISNPGHLGNVMPLIHSQITIVKINGDYLDTKFLNIESELSDYNKDLVDHLHFIFENFGLITAGWSAKWDIALRAILENANKFRFSNYFTYANKCEKELEELSNRRRGKLIKIDSADRFFKELLENVEALENGELQNPLTKGVAIARLRKYIAREDLQISLYELMKQQQNISYGNIFDYDRLPNPDADNVRALIEYRLSQIEILCTLLAEGVYWGKPFHNDIWFNQILKFSYPRRDNSSWVVWSSLSYFPAFVVFYTIGIGAVLKRDYSFLNKLFSLQIENPYRQGEKWSIVNQLNSEKVLEKRYLNNALKKSQIAPMSELLFNFIKPLYIDFLPSENSFEDVFDEFELIFCLKFLQYNDEGWIPPGRYSYRRRNPNHIIYTKFKSLELYKDLDDWITGHLFSDAENLLKHYHSFNSKVKNMGWE